MSGPVAVVQHSEDCGPGLFGEWLAEAGADLDVRRPYAGDPLPDRCAALMVLGGPMGANDDDQHAWLPPTKALIRATVAAGTPFLGICLGHQLASVALGGTVAPNPLGQQLGVLPLGWLPADPAQSNPEITPSRRKVTPDPLFDDARPALGIQWNDDIVTELPPGARVLAQTPAGEPQVVRFADQAWGLQLHPEADLATIAAWAVDDAERHLTAGIDQDALLDGVAAAMPELRRAWQPVAHAFAQLVR